MSFLPQSTILGQLELVEIYSFYDQPALFSCRNAAGSIFMVVWIDENDEFDTWLYASMSQRRFEHVRSGAIDLHDAFSKTEDGIVFIVRAPHDEELSVSVDSVSATSIEEGWLPQKGECLGLETQITAELDRNIVRKAIQTGRDYISITLDFLSSTRSEAPAKELGEFLESLQNLIDAVGEAVIGQVSWPAQIAKELLHKTQLSVITVGPGGSLVIELASSNPTDEFGHSEVADVITELARLLDMSNDLDSLSLALSRLSPRVTSQYVKLLQPISDYVANAQLEWASPTRGVGESARISALTALTAVNYITQWEERSIETHEIRGTLIGANIRTKHFEIETPEKRYSGRISDEAWPTASRATLSNTYTATIRETIIFKPATESTESKYHLVDLKPYEEE